MKIRSEFKKWLSDDRVRFSCLFLMLGIISWIWQRPEPTALPPLVQNFEIDQSLPDGLSASTVDLVNSDAISAMIGANAIVDLFTTEPQTLKPNRKVASRVKLARSPGDHERFFIVVSDEHLKQILQFPGPYFATVQSRKRRDTQILQEAAKVQNKVQFQEEL